jgi:mono/diheme cytochrome c family protein
VSRALLVSGIAFLLVGFAGLGVASALLSRPPRLDDAVARGQWIFLTGTDPDTGLPIPSSGGPMMSMACSDCHGPDGRGLRTPMFVSPDIRYRNLTDPAGMVEPDGTRGPQYRSDEEIRRAITDGIGPDGASLAWPMPRWHLTDQQFADLLAYLKALP